ncbi:MAG TPA: hypothetical protein VLG39_07815 [Nitrospirota bacterium]|nr:hypothetical protein [Nitrospirota bacterium]
MPLYLIKTRHTLRNCLAALDEQLTHDVQSLHEFVYTCGEGEHAGYAIVEANNRSEAMNIVPEPLRGEASVWKVDRFSPEDIRSFHAKAS